MIWWFASGHAVDLVLAIIAVEFLWLIVFRRWRWSDAALLLLPGVMMLLAVRAALTGAGWPIIAALLALSFPFHLADIIRRERHRR